MGKIKIHEIAKELELNSKEVVEKAKELGISVKNHLSSVEENEAENIKKAFNKKTEIKVEVDDEAKIESDKPSKKEQSTKKDKAQNTPVIIRRAVILEDEVAKQKQEKQQKQEKRNQEIGFVDKRKTDYNIVYRNKQAKPLTLDELFGTKNEKEEISTKTEEIQNNPVEETKKETVQSSERPQRPNYDNQRPNNYNNNYNNEQRQGYNNQRSNNNNYNNGQRQGYNNQRSNNYNNNYNNGQRQGYNNQRPYNNNNNEQRQGYNNQRPNNYNNNYNNGQRPNYNNQRNNGYDNRNNRPLDNRGIEKNIKNIMSLGIVEKESVREYGNKAIDKQKNSRYEENKNKKATKSKRNEDYEISTDKLKDLKQSDGLSNMFNEGTMFDYYDLTTERGKKNKRKMAKMEQEERNKQKIFKLTDITIPEEISVKDLAAELKKTSGEIIKKLLDYGIMATINKELDFDTAFLIAGEFGIVAHKKEIVKEEDILFDDSEDNEEELISRPPVIVVMGHVDHGKTSLLDAIRSTNVIEGEAGGITQHIGAYKVEINGREITFLDTPGHEAFTSMRARGAQITDIAILVVAANDGVMPQTVEAINHAKAAGIPIIVAVNKIDLEGANVEKIKQQLMEYELVPEEWGGDTIFVPISAKKKLNIDNLLEMVLLVADMKDLKVNPNKQGKGVVIEAKLDKNKGPVATMLVQRGKLDVGDTIVVGSVIGRIRAMKNDKGQIVKSAGPSTPVEITGLTEVPEAGETFYEVKDEKMAKHLIERRKRQERDKQLNATSKVTLDDLFNQIEKGDLKQLNIIVKADVQGSVEAVKQSLEKLSNEKVEVKVIHANVGAVTESDVTLAKVSNAIVIAFNVRPVLLAKNMAEKDEVEIKTYSVIYQAIEDVEAAMKGMQDPEYKEVIIGNAQVRQIFKVSNVGTIAGAYITDGKITRHSTIRVIRENVVIHEGEIESLKRFKDDAKEVAYGYECGIQLKDFNDIQENDILEAHIMEEIK